MMLAWVDLSLAAVAASVIVGVVINVLIGKFFQRINGQGACILLCVLLGPLGWLISALLPKTAAREVEYERELERLRRARISVCPGCRYDLTGNMSGTCPECGLELDARKSAREAADAIDFERWRAQQKSRTSA